MKKTIGNFVRTALAVVALTGSQWAVADVAVGSVIKLDSSAGNLGGGAFTASVVSGVGFGGPSFQTFCLEYQEHVDYYGQSLRVSGISNATVNGNNAYYATDAAANPEGGLHTANSDPLSKATEWLFTQFYDNKTAYAGTTALSNSTQRAIWFLEGELYTDSLKNGYLADTTAVSFVNAANAAVAKGWSDVGDRVRVLNLFKGANFTEHAQDQLYMVTAVPEPGTYGMMLVGVGLIGTIASRRRKNKNT